MLVCQTSFPSTPYHLCRKRTLGQPHLVSVSVVTFDLLYTTFVTFYNYLIELTALSESSVQSCECYGLQKLVRVIFFVTLYMCVFD